MAKGSSMRADKLMEFDDGTAFYVSSTPDAQFIYAEIFREGCYDHVELPEQPFVVDVGAHLGMFSVYVKRRRPQARVLAFEPSPATVELLRRNVALHGLDQVVIADVALGARQESGVTFTYYPIAPGNSTRYPHEKERQKQVMARTLPAKVVERVHQGLEISVEVERLSTFLVSEPSVDLLKIDVEGAELEVLQGIDDPHWPLIGQVLLEVQDLDGRLAAVCELLQRHGLTASARLAPMADPDIGNYVVHGVRA
jgi:FkbM family methyltransferase